MSEKKGSNQQSGKTPTRPTPPRPVERRDSGDNSRQKSTIGTGPRDKKG
jgi:hypothetical protein